MVMSLDPLRPPLSPTYTYNLTHHPPFSTHIKDHKYYFLPHNLIFNNILYQIKEVLQNPEYYNRFIIVGYIINTVSDQ